MIKNLLLLAGALLLCCAAGYAQNREVSGKVTSQEDGSILPGVNVVVKGTTNGTTTDGNGSYRINVPDGNVTLVFSFIGIKTQEVEVGDRTIIDITMVSDISQLNEVVIVGYGTQLKQDVTGNIAKISGSAIQNVPVTSVEQALQGRATGVLITSQNGKVGQGINVRVRGTSSISAGNEPLYVIDGMIVNTSNLSGSTAPTNPLADINFNDIQSIEILKDASAAAIYGARAANGVVLITTKRGQTGKTNFSVNMQYGSSKPTHHREFLNSEQYIELFREAAVNRDLAAGYDPTNNPDDYPDSYLEGIEETFDFLSGDTDWRKLETNTDWENEAYQKANISNLDLTASGGNEKTKFYFSGGYSGQDGILIGNKFQRYSGRINVDHQVGEKLSFGVNVNTARTLNDRVADDKQFYSPIQLVAQSPLTPVRDKQGNLFDNTFNPAMLYYPATVELENSAYTTSVFRNISVLNARYAFTENLSFTGEYGFDLLTQQEDRFQNSLTEDGSSVGGTSRSRWAQVFNQTYRAYLTWSKSSQQHTFDVTAGSDFQQKTMDITNSEAQGSSVIELRPITIPTAASKIEEEEVFLSYYARANYKYNDRYLLSLSMRYDGSSKFGADKKYGVFPAASIGWILSEEGFIKNSEVISFLKIRSSYGLTGNANIPNYQYLGLYSLVSYDGVSGLSKKQINNPDLGWESTTQIDVGLDFGFFNDRLTGEVDYYNKQTSDLLLDKEIPSTLSLPSVFGNVGKMENKGVELALNYSIVKNSNLTWDIGVNVARNKNKVLALDGNQEIIDPGSSRFLNVVKVGEPIGVYYGPEYAGVDAANGDALWFVNGETPGETTNNYNNANKVVLGNPTPTVIYGATMNVMFKGFDLNLLFQGVSGNELYNAAGSFMSANARYEDNQTIDQLRRWQKPGDITDVPQARLYRNNGAQASSRYLSDGSYLRLKTITLGYTLPNALVSKASLTSVRIYFTGQNMFTFTSYEGWDPEVNTDYTADTAYYIGNDFYSAPQAKNLIVGIKVGF